MVYPPGVWSINCLFVQWKLVHTPHFYWWFHHNSFILSLCECVRGGSQTNLPSVSAADLLHGCADAVHSWSQFVLDRAHCRERHPLPVPVTTLINWPSRSHSARCPHVLFPLVWMNPVAGSYTAPGTTSTSTSSCPSSCEPWLCWRRMTYSSIERPSALTSRHWWGCHLDCHHCPWRHHPFLHQRPVRMCLLGYIYSWLLDASIN